MKKVSAYLMIFGFVALAALPSFALRVPPGCVQVAGDVLCGAQAY